MTIEKGHLKWTQVILLTLFLGLYFLYPKYFTYGQVRAETYFDLNHAQMIYIEGYQPDYSISSDINNDGRNDVISVGSSSNSVAIFTGSSYGNGFFDEGVTIPDVGVQPSSVAAADFDKDGNVDLAVTNSGDNTITIIKNLGNGVFDVGVTYSVLGESPNFVKAGDFNGDENIDLIVTNATSNTITFLGNPGNGTFGTGSTYPSLGIFPNSIAVAEFSGDSNLDFAVSNYESNSVTVYKSLGNGTFEVGSTNPDLCGHPSTIAAADFDGNQGADIAIGCSNSNNLTVINNYGDATFGLANTYTATQMGILSLAPADMNEDGTNDLIWIGNNTVTVFNNIGNQSFGEESTFSILGYDGRYLIADDFNQDGHTDVAVVNPNSNETDLLTNIAYMPRNLTGTAGSKQVSLSWTAPELGTVTGYRVEHSTNFDFIADVVDDGLSVGTSATVTGLTNGTRYYFRVKRVDASGTKEVSDYISLTPVGILDAPTNLSGTAGNGQVTLNWTVTNGETATDYEVQYKISTGLDWFTFTDGVSVGTSATVTGLTNWTNYSFRVRAVDGSESGGWSEEITVMPEPGDGTTSPPINLVGTAGDGQVFLTWLAPATGTVTDYQIEYKPGLEDSWQVFDDGVSVGTSATVTGLTNDVTYDLRVKGVNANGVGAASSEVIVTPAAAIPGAPGAPTNLSGTAGDSQVSLTWTAGVGETATDYQIEYRMTVSGAWLIFDDGVSINTTATVNGLTNDSSYVFRVKGKNTAGLGPASNEITVTPSTSSQQVPGAPTNLSGTAGDSQVSLTWTAGVGETATDYQVEYKENESLAWLIYDDGVSTNTNTVASGLTNGTSYNFRVKGKNSAGTSSASNEVTVTPTKQLGAPINLTGIAGDGRVTLSWTAPESADITDYQVEYKTSTTDTWSVFNDGVSVNTTAVVTGLTNGTSYDFRVAGIDTAGLGIFSAAITLTPSNVDNSTPGAPTNLTGTAGDGRVSLTWTASVGATIVDYQVSYKINNQTTWSVFDDGVSTNTTTTVTGLTNGTSYDFRVAGINTNGLGAVSETITVTPRSESSGGGNSSSGGGSSSGPSRPVCQDIPPIEKPDLFEIRANKGKVKLFFTSVSRATGYAVIYGHKKDDERFGSIEGLTNNNQGVQNVTINMLDPKTTYYFKVAAINGCTAGPWSDWVPVRANANKTIYKYITVIKNKIKTLVNRYK
jgi:titin